MALHQAAGPQSGMLCEIYIEALLVDQAQADTVEHLLRAGQISCAEAAAWLGG